MKRSKRFYVISEKCVGCGACKTICKVHAISKGNPYTINENKCTGCGLCVTRCWRDVITEKQRADS